MWRLFLDFEENIPKFLDEEIVHRGKTVPFFPTTQTIQTKKGNLRKVRLRNVTLFANDGQIQRELEMINIKVITLYREVVESGY